MSVFKRGLRWGHPTAGFGLQTSLSQRLDNTAWDLVRGNVIVLLARAEIDALVRVVLACGQEILLCRLGHHKAHASYPSVCIACFVLDWPAVLIDNACLHDTWVRVWWLPPEHAAVIHSVGNQGNILLDVIWIRLHTLMALVFLVQIGGLVCRHNPLVSWKHRLIL